MKKKNEKRYNPVPESDDCSNELVEIAENGGGAGNGGDPLQQQQQQQQQDPIDDDNQKNAEESRKLVDNNTKEGVEREEGEDSSIVVHLHHPNNVNVNVDQHITVDDAIERLGMGKFQLLVLIAAGLCFAADAMQVLMLSFLCEVLKLEWDLTDDETAFITSILFTGSIFGTLILGPLADRKGRKPVFLLAASIISFFGMSVGFVTNYWNLLATLFMVGFGVGGLAVPFDILAEFLPANSRGKNLLIIEYFWTVGVLFVVLVAHATLGSSSSNGNWRLFVMISALPCFTSIFIGWIFVPESARWLCTQGRCEEAMHILKKAAITNGKDVDILFPEGTQLLKEEEEESNFLELFSPRWKWTTIKLWGGWGCFAFGYYGTIMVITEIFDKETRLRELLSSSDTATSTSSTTYNFDYGAIFVSSSAELLGTTFAILLVDTVGRIPLQVVSYAMAGISVCALCIFAENDAQRDVLIAIGFVARIFEMSGSCTTWVNTAEILTTDVRTTGHSAANAVARIGSLTAPFLIEGKSSLLNKGLVMLAIHSITVFCVSQLPETKGSHFGRVHGEEEDDDDDDHDLALTEEISNVDDDDDDANESSAAVNNDDNATTHHHQIT